jgi:hypothetical protein
VHQCNFEKEICVDQYYGLNAWARDLLSNTVEVEEKGERIYPDNSSEHFSRMIFLPVHRTESISALDGSGDPSNYRLYRHHFPDGSVYEEFVQTVLLYSGRCYFIALKQDDEVVSESLWQKEEMKSATY